MKMLTMANAKHGPLFKTMNYLTVLHAAATESLRGDQAHFGVHLLSFHSSYALMVETTLLIIGRGAKKTFEGLPPVVVELGRSIANLVRRILWNASWFR
jgi:hypothetical protein